MIILSGIFENGGLCQKERLYPDLPANVIILSGIFENGGLCQKHFVVAD